MLKAIQPDVLRWSATQLAQELDHCKRHTTLPNAPRPDLVFAVAQFTLQALLADRLANRGAVDELRHHRAFDMLTAQADIYLEAFAEAQAKLQAQEEQP